MLFKTRYSSSLLLLGNNNKKKHWPYDAPVLFVYFDCLFDISAYLIVITFYVQVAFCQPVNVVDDDDDDDDDVTISYSLDEWMSSAE